MSTKIIGTQIDQATRAIMTALSVTEQINLPSLNQTAVNALGTPAYGTLVYNSTEDAAQMWKADSGGAPGWASVGGGGPSIGENSIIRTNGPTISENLTVGPTVNAGAEFTNGFSAGPITIANGYTVTIENGATWNILGGDDYSTFEVNDIIATNGMIHNLSYKRKDEVVHYVTDNGTVYHSLNDGSTLWITRESGGDFSLYINDVPTGTGNCYHLKVVTEESGANDRPTAIYINGNRHDVQWENGGLNGSDYKYHVTWFEIYDKPNPEGGYSDDDNYTVFATGNRYQT